MITTARGHGLRSAATLGALWTRASQWFRNIHLSIRAKILLSLCCVIVVMGASNAVLMLQALTVSRQYDAIIWMAESKKTDDVIELVSNLSNFFRIGLSKGKDWITIGEEIERTRSYLDPEDALSRYHGFFDRRGSGRRAERRVLATRSSPPAWSKACSPCAAATVKRSCQRTRSYNRAKTASTSYLE